MILSSKILAAALVAAALPLTGSASAAPLSTPLVAMHSAQAQTAPIENVQWRRGWGGFGPGLVAGAIIGGVLGARPYGYYGYGPYAYGYDGGYVAVAPGYSGGGDSDAYCAQRFRSWDSRSGTYLGYDGIRHPCP